MIHVRLVEMEPGFCPYSLMVERAPYKGLIHVQLMVRIPVFTPGLFAGRERSPYKGNMSRVRSSGPVRCRRSVAEHPTFNRNQG